MNEKIKHDERGRGKYRPNSNASPEDIKNILFDKIEEEKKRIEQLDSSESVKGIKLNNIDKLSVLSLFSGAGGLDLGFELAGLDACVGREKTDEIIKSKETFVKNREQGLFETIYANDIFEEALATYENNIGQNTFISKNDIRKIKDFPISDIVLGGFPCPGFSGAGPRLIDDERNFLYMHFIRVLIQTQPKVFVGENVKGMLTLGKGEVFKQIKEDFEAAGYIVQEKLVNARDYGVPQLRERVFLVGIRNDLIGKVNYVFPDVTHGTSENLLPYVSLRDAIYDFKDLPGDYFKGSYSSIYMSRNRKKKWEDQSFTIQASGRQAPLHPDGETMEKVGRDEWIFPDGEENHRRLSVKEIQRIQTFPDWYEFNFGSNQISETGRLNKIYKQIGNAVPVELARTILAPLASELLKMHGKAHGE